MSPKPPLPRVGTPGAYTRYAGLGIQFAVGFLVFFGAGFWADQKFGTRPLFTLLGLALGATASIWWLILQVPSAGSTRAKGKADVGEDS